MNKIVVFLERFIAWWEIRQGRRIGGRYLR